MAKLTTKARKALPKADFALPNSRFPVNDKSHAIAAKARATQGVAKGSITPAQKVTIDRKANAKLSKSGARGR